MILGKTNAGSAPNISGLLLFVFTVTEWAIDDVCSRMEGGVIQAYVG